MPARDPSLPCQIYLIACGSCRSMSPTTLLVSRQFKRFSRRQTISISLFLMLESQTLVSTLFPPFHDVSDHPELGALLDITVETAQNVMDTNFFGTVRFVRLIGPHMVKRKKGLILPVGSTAGELSVPFMGYYNPSKAALHSYAETLALELKPFGVHVMLCSPGTVKSNIANVIVAYSSSL